MTKPSDHEFHYVEGVFRLEKHAMVAVGRCQCAFCGADAPLPSKVDVSYAIEVGRESIAPFGEEDGDYWPREAGAKHDWVLLVYGADTRKAMCPTCAKARLEKTP